MEVERLLESRDATSGSPLKGKDAKNVDTKVKVALRVRPMIAKEMADSEQKCVTCNCSTNQVYIGKDRSFTFDRVFDDYSKQSEVYEACAYDLVLSSFKGYNATVLAYGQTGSGKTFTMGSSTSYENKPEDAGIIPRTIRELFLEIEKRRHEAEFLVKVSFLEIYNEEIQDLLDSSIISNSRRFNVNNNSNNNKAISIREEKDGSINVYGIVEEKVNSYEELSACLERGSLHRSTASTLMNETSSRSHGIFTIFLEMHKISDLVDSTKLELEGTERPAFTSTAPITQINNPKGPNAPDESEFMTAKFHFVDLAGSERLKKTGASGSVMREGININRGLLALGNVISALTEETTKFIHVPYRESKLTRILQDSLGGNSRTYMIACISPAESNFEESLNSLKYASRARNIKNKPIVNRDPQSAIISQLKQQIYELQGELIQYKKIVKMDPIQQMSIDIPSPVKGPYSQSLKAHDEANNEIIKNLKLKLLTYEKENNQIKAELQINKKALNESDIKWYSIQRERDLLKILTEKYKKAMQDNGIAFQLEDENLQELDGKNIYEEHVSTIEKLKSELNDKDKLNKELQFEFENLLKKGDKDNELLLLKTKVIANLKKQIKKKDLSNNPNNNSTMESSMVVEKRNDEESGAETSRTVGGNDLNEDDPDMELKSEDDERIEQEYETNANLHRKELHLVDGHISEKEELLKRITQSQMALERNLVDEMKNQYYNKIHQLEQEMKYIEKQRDEALRKTSSSMQEGDKSKLMSGYKQKITEMENKLKDFRKKEKEQGNMMKLVQNQQSKLEQLADEIKKIKNQKIEMHKKMREEQDKYDKWRNSRQKELTMFKKKNQEKDAEINKLKNENRRKEEIYKKRTEEILANFMTPEMIKQLGNGTVHNRKNSKIMRKNSALPRLIDLESSLHQENTVISENDARSLLEYCIQKIFETLELHFLVSREEESLKKSEQELEEQQHKYSVIMLQKDKLEMEKEQNKEEAEIEPTILLKIQELEMQLNEIYTRIETQEEKIGFQQNKIQDFTRQISEKAPFDPEKALFSNEKLKNNILNYQLLLRILLGKFVNANVEQYQTNERLNHTVVESSELRKKLEETEQKNRLTELQYEVNLTKLHKEYEEKQYFWMRQGEVLNYEDESSGTLDDKENINAATLQQDMNSSAGFTTLAQARAKKQLKITGTGNSPAKRQPETVGTPVIRQKNLDVALEDVKKKDKQIADMVKRQQNSDKTIETLKRKCEVLQAKYDQQKRQNAKEKFIGIEKRSDEATPTDRPATAGHHHSGSYGNLTVNTSVVSNSQQNLQSFMTSSLGSKRHQEIKSATASAHPNPYGLTQPAKNVSLSSFRDRRKEEKEKLTVNVNVTRTSANNSIEPHSSDDVRHRRFSGTINTTASSFAASRGLGLQQARHNKSNSIAFNAKRQSSPSRCQSRFDSPLPKNRDTYKSIDNNSETVISSLTDDYGAMDCEGVSGKFLLDDRALELGPKYNNEQWKNVASIDAQMGVLYSVVSYGNMIYTSSNKVFKAWSLDTLQCISEVNAHSSVIKTMAVWPEKNVLVTASDKVINVWDLVSLQSIGTLRGHKDEIRALHVSNDMLISAGKGGVANGSVLTWDLRSLNPCDEREKNQDIFCMTSYNNTLYYGNRNHQVRRLNLSTMDSLSPFEPPHLDAVTSMTMFKGSLVSGSRDKNLRLWDLDSCIHNLKNTSYAHQDWINVVQTNPADSLLYSGSRDGVVKVWGVSNSKLCCISDILAHSGAVNSLCSVNESSSNLFVTASADKMVKIWKFDTDESNIASTNKGSNDEIMIDESLQASYQESPEIKSRRNSRTTFPFDDISIPKPVKDVSSFTNASSLASINGGGASHTIIENLEMAIEKENDN